MSLPFTGETMTCVMCGKQKQSDAAVESNWRSIVIDGSIYYACINEFPRDTANSKQFARAYKNILKRVMVLRKKGASAPLN